MRRAIARAFGPPAEVVTVEPYRPDPPAAGRVAVRMTAAAVNPSDLVTISGAYPSRTPLPLVPGFEGVGVVERLGPEVSGLAVGDRVLPLGSPGAWQEVKTTEARWCFRVHPELTDLQAATCYINPLTAKHMIERHVDPRHRPRVVVNAAGSAIAGMLARMLRRRGITPLGLVRGRPDRPELTGPEWGPVVSTASPGWPAELLAHLGGGPDVVFDAVGGTEGRRLALALRGGGCLVHYGLLSGRPLPADLPARRPDIVVRPYLLRSWVHSAAPEEIQRALDEAGELVLSGDAATPRPRRFPLDEIGAAIRAGDAAGGAGKALILP